MSYIANLSISISTLAILLSFISCVERLYTKRDIVYIICVFINIWIVINILQWMYLK